jgi:hypothetical protein
VRHDARTLIAISASFLLASAVAPIACVDLFHATHFENACELDAAACDPEASTSPFPTDFCAWTPAVAQNNAYRACAWLGACASPVGDNAFGPCAVQATLAYDCDANPNRRLLPGATHDFWDRLWRAQSCADVSRAIAPPNTVAQCAPSDASYAGCPFGGGALLTCEANDAGMALESCVAAGKICASVNGVSECAGSSAACAGEEAGSSCVGATQLRDCDPAVGVFDQGLDCASVGGGRCVPGTLPACAAVGDAGCTPSAAVSCANGVASGCPSGVVEQVDCTALLGTSSCDPGASGRPWDVSRACNAGSCANVSDTCSPDGARLTSCARGASISVDCATVGLSSCKIDEVTQRAVCVPHDGVANAP